MLLSGFSETDELANDSDTGNDGAVQLIFSFDCNKSSVSRSFDVCADTLVGERSDWHEGPELSQAASTLLSLFKWAIRLATLALLNSPATQILLFAPRPTAKALPRVGLPPTSMAMASYCMHGQAPCVVSRIQRLVTREPIRRHFIAQTRGGTLSFWYIYQIHCSQVACQK